MTLGKENECKYKLLEAEVMKLHEDLKISESELHTVEAEREKLQKELNSILNKELLMIEAKVPRLKQEEKRTIQSLQVEVNEVLDLVKLRVKTN